VFSSTPIFLRVTEKVIASTQAMTMAETDLAKAEERWLNLETVRYQS